MRTHHAEAKAKAKPKAGKETQHANEAKKPKPRSTRAQKHAEKAAALEAARRSPHLSSDALRQSAQIIAAARSSLKPLPTLQQQLSPNSVEDGYRIQSEVHQILATELGPLVGYKIGCTRAGLY